LVHQAVQLGQAGKPPAASNARQRLTSASDAWAFNTGPGRILRRQHDPPVVDVRLTPTEWHLLEVLVRHPGKLLSQRQLLTEVWGPGYETAGGNLRGLMAQLQRLGSRARGS
jgi:DNA-binding response OmpR family regulator